MRFDETDELVKKLLEAILEDHGRECSTPTCRDSHISRRHSRLLWLITVGAYFEMFVSVTEADLQISTKE